MVIETCGDHIEVADTDEKELQVFMAKAFDLMLFDLGLPDINGITLAKKIRQIEASNKRIPIAIVTSR